MFFYQELRQLASFIKQRAVALKIRILKRDVYVKMNNPEWPWVFISYIPSVFYLGKGAQSERGIKMAYHQNRQEMVRMVPVFSELGYNVYVMDHTSKRNLPDINVKIIFGLPPAFQRACEKYKTAMRVYYATGAYYTHQTSMVKRMTDELNFFFNNSHIPYRRMVAPHNSCQIADRVLMIGSKYTIETYPQEVRYKISLIHQSTQSTITLADIRFAKESEFVFMASGGNALKGVGLLIKYFSEHADYTIHIIGPIEYDVMKAIGTSLPPNIILHGFMNVNDRSFLSILERCNFLIYPSGSEGCPGAVLNLMKNGIIPIVSKWAAFDEINDYGYMLEDVSIQAIDRAVKWSCRLKEEEIIMMKKRVKQYTEKTYNLDRFTSELKSFLMTLN